MTEPKTPKARPAADPERFPQQPADVPRPEGNPNPVSVPDATPDRHPAPGAANVPGDEDTKDYIGGDPDTDSDI